MFESWRIPRSVVYYEDEWSIRTIFESLFQEQDRIELSLLL
jgi:hypothetical protein